MCSGSDMRLNIVTRPYTIGVIYNSKISSHINRLRFIQLMVERGKLECKTRLFVQLSSFYFEISQGKHQHFQRKQQQIISEFRVQISDCVIVYLGLILFTHQSLPASTSAPRINLNVSNFFKEIKVLGYYIYYLSILYPKALLLVISDFIDIIVL